MKFSALDPDLAPPMPANREELRQRTYDATVECYAYDSLYAACVACVETDPLMPIDVVIPLLEAAPPREVLEQVDPATLCCEIFSRNVIAQEFADAWNRMLDSFKALDSWSMKMVWRRLGSEQPRKDDMNRRRSEIMRDMLSAWATKQDRKKMGDEELREFDAWWQKARYGGFLQIENYNADAGDRIWDLLERKNVGRRDRLKQSVAAAGAQLELLSKRDGRYGSRVVLAAPGTVPIVLAHDKKAFTVQLLPAPRQTLAETIEAAIAYAGEVGDIAGKWSYETTVAAIKNLIENHGRAPGQKSDELSQEYNLRVIGCLFAAMPDETKTDAIKRIETAIGEELCLALIGLLGKGSETELCMTWLSLPLAPYAAIKE